MRTAYPLIAVSTLFAAISSAAPVDSPPLLTRDQQNAQSTALSIRREPLVIAARDASIKRYEAAPPALLADGKALLRDAIDEAVFGSLLSAVNDPARPTVIWNEELPYRVGTVSIPGSRFAGDDPDRIYRTIAVDRVHRYEIHGQRRSQASLDFSFEAIPAPSLWGKARAVLPAKDIDIGPDGSFTVTADATPTAGRRNHLQLPPGTVNILTRDTLDDWSRELPNELTVKRIDETSAVASTHAELVNRAAQTITQSTDEALKFLRRVWKNAPNHIHPFVRGLGDGVKGAVVATDRFKLKDNEALLITLDPISAQYLAIEVTDPWLRSVEYQHHNASLSNLQAKANADGSFTYVLALQDPGVHNWLDPAGLHDGILIIRWELLSAPPQVDKAVREARTVKLAELASILSAGTARVSPEERRRELAARGAAYALRVAQD